MSTSIGRGLKRGREPEVAHAPTSCIDPQLTTLGISAGNSTNCSSSHGSAQSDAATLQTPSLTTGSASGSEHNDFDVALETVCEEGVPVVVSKQASDYLKVWRFHNDGRLPSKKHIKCLEGLTNTSGAVLVQWLNRHSISPDGSNTLFHPMPSKSAGAGGSERPRCLQSSFRHQTQREADCSGMYPCTNRCGKTFDSKSNWDRHERINFEEWACEICTKVVSRKSHLQEHVKDQHKSNSKVSPEQRRELFASTRRPCGFCATVLESWPAWLRHVADHFEGAVPDGPRTMADWVEHRDMQACDIEDKPRDAQRDVTTNEDHAMSHWGGYDRKLHLPPDTLDDLNSIGLTDLPSPLNWMKKEDDSSQRKPKLLLTLPVGDPVSSLDAPSVLLERTLRGDDDVGALSPEMAAMVISEIKYRCSRHAATSSNISCCCKKCANRLGLETPGVQTTPGIIDGSDLGSDDGKLAMLGTFLIEGSYGPWTQFRIERR